MRRLLLILFLALPAQAANEIRAFEAGASTCFAVVREIDGDVWQVAGQVFEAWGTGGRTAADYDIALTDKSGGMFVGNFDTNIGAGQYYIVTYMQAGGSPADSDPAVWQDYGYWDGSTWDPHTLKTIEDKVDAVDADVADILADTDELQGLISDSKMDAQVKGMDAGTVTAAAVATDAIDADALSADAVDKIHDEVVEGTVTLRQAIRLFLSVLTGKSSGGGTATITFRDIGDTKNRLQVTVDAQGNRTAVGTRDGE